MPVLKKKTTFPRTAQGAFEYVLLLAGILLLVILAVVILRGTLLTSANDQVQASASTLRQISSGCDTLSSFVIDPSGDNATLDFCHPVNPAQTLVFVYSDPVVFNGSTSDLGTFMNFSFSNQRVKLDIRGKRGSALDNSTSHRASAYLAGDEFRLLIRNLTGEYGQPSSVPYAWGRANGEPESTATPTPTPTATPTPQINPPDLLLDQPGNGQTNLIGENVFNATPTFYDSPGNASLTVFWTGYSSTQPNTSPLANQTPFAIAANLSQITEDILWNLRVCDVGGRCTQSANRTLHLVAPPIIRITNPANQSKLPSGTITFAYNFSDAYGAANASLFINTTPYPGEPGPWVMNLMTASPANDTPLTFEFDPNVGIFAWAVQVCNAHVCAMTPNRTLVASTPYQYAGWSWVSANRTIGSVQDILYENGQVYTSGYQAYGPGDVMNPRIEARHANGTKIWTYLQPANDYAWDYFSDLRYHNGILLANLRQQDQQAVVRLNATTGQLLNQKSLPANSRTSTMDTDENGAAFIAPQRWASGGRYVQLSKILPNGTFVWNYTVNRTGDDYTTDLAYADGTVLLLTTNMTNTQADRINATTGSVLSTHVFSTSGLSVQTASDGNWFYLLNTTINGGTMVSRLGQYHANLTLIWSANVTNFEVTMRKAQNGRVWLAGRAYSDTMAGNDNPEEVREFYALNGTNRGNRTADISPYGDWIVTADDGTDGLFLAGQNGACYQSCWDVRHYNAAGSVLWSAWNEGYGSTVVSSQVDIDSGNLVLASRKQYISSQATNQYLVQVVGLGVWAVNGTYPVNNNSYELLSVAVMNGGLATYHYASPEWNQISVVDLSTGAQTANYTFDESSNGGKIVALNGKLYTLGDEYNSNPYYTPVLSRFDPALNLETQVALDYSSTNFHTLDLASDNESTLVAGIWNEYSSVSEVHLFDEATLTDTPIFTGPEFRYLAAANSTVAMAAYSGDVTVIDYSGTTLWTATINPPTKMAMTVHNDNLLILNLEPSLQYANLTWWDLPTGAYIRSVMINPTLPNQPFEIVGMSIDDQQRIFVTLQYNTGVLDVIRMDP